jgi:hypothetical protein|tara:strand:- start:471 stop:629 length:159 start_codon:yes stop_codon:yes gene_type:complete
MKNTSDDFAHINTTNTMHNFASLRVLDGTEEEEDEEEEEEEGKTTEGKSAMR